MKRCTFMMPTMVPPDWGKFCTPVTILAVVKKAVEWVDKNINKHINATGGLSINPTTEAHMKKYPKKLWIAPAKWTIHGTMTHKNPSSYWLLQRCRGGQRVSQRCLQYPWKLTRCRALIGRSPGLISELRSRYWRCLYRSYTGSICLPPWLSICCCSASPSFCLSEFSATLNWLLTILIWRDEKVSPPAEGLNFDACFLTFLD